MIYGYARVSTLKQVRKGHSLSDQVHILKQHHCKKIFKEQYTGMTSNRPKFKKLDIVLDKGDTVIVTRLDRLARNMTDMLNTVREWHKRGVTVILLKPRLTIRNTSNGRLLLGIFATFAQFERDMIHDRMQEGKINALKAGDKNAKGGRPSRLQNNKAHYEAINKYAKKHTAKQTAKAFACGVRTVYYVKAMFRK